MADAPMAAAPTGKADVKISVVLTVRKASALPPGRSAPTAPNAPARMAHSPARRATMTAHAALLVAQTTMLARIKVRYGNLTVVNSTGH
jgi:hypothetical protein